MKKELFRLSSILSLAVLTTFASCSSDRGGDEVDPTPTPSAVVELKGDLSTQTLKKDTKYLIVGQVFVRSGQTLTVEPGTVIYGDKATKGVLVIDRGGKLNAVGTAAEPIVFTSGQPVGTRDRGDWGGLVILGNAPVNQNEPAIEGIAPAVIFGGTDANDNSGALKYVRVEFAGIELTPNNETNSITLGGVGKGTEMEYCQVSFGGDDGFEWFGGTIDGKHLISFATWDDDFDVDYGYTGNNQFGVAVRYPSYADQSGSNGFETDNGPNDNVTSLLTTGTFSNFTIIGPKLTSNQSINANFQHALDMRRRTAVTIANSVFAGFPRGLRMNQASVLTNYQNNTGALFNNVMLANTQTFSAGSGMNVADVEAYWNLANETSTSSDYAAVLSAWGLNSNIFFGNNVATAYSSNPTFEVTSGTLTTGADFTNAKVSGAFFTKVAYRGAFGSTDWTTGWAEFNPVNKAY
ncbi:MAG: hypothetical protein Q4G16_00905 [Cruoricaptor ignavus]|nr:hypothetical protein [Cruoricaptor ignavus]